jgi:hypothetical protein
VDGLSGEVLDLFAAGAGPFLQLASPIGGSIRENCRLFRTVGVAQPARVEIGGEVFIGFQNGSVDHFDAYGRKPWQKGYGTRERDEHNLYRFQGEFARLYGPVRRGRPFPMGRDIERDDDEMHALHLSWEKRGIRRKKKSPEAAANVSDEKQTVS